MIVCDGRHGSVVGGRYRLEQVLHCGPDRCVHRAHDVLLRRAVTTVIAAPSDGEPVPEAVTLPISARLPHGPGLAEVYDGGDDDGVLYLVVPRIEGTSLADDLATGPLPVAEVRELGAQIALALLPIHRHGCAHGALGAALVTRGPTGVTVAGLGVDEWLHRWAHQHRDPPHPAPEQRGPAPSVSPATDVYALGRLLGAAAGRLPRKEPLRVVLRAMTARDPALRPDTVELLDLLHGTSLPRSARRVLTGTVTTVALVGALALGGLVAQAASTSAGLFGGATVGAATPSRSVEVPRVVSDTATGHTATAHTATAHTATAHTATGHTATSHTATGHTATGHTATSSTPSGARQDGGHRSVDPVAVVVTQEAGPARPETHASGATSDEPEARDTVTSPDAPGPPSSRVRADRPHVTSTTDPRKTAPRSPTARAGRHTPVRTPRSVVPTTTRPAPTSPSTGAKKSSRASCSSLPTCMSGPEVPPQH